MVATMMGTILGTGESPEARQASAHRLGIREESVALLRAWAQRVPTIRPHDNRARPLMTL